MKPHKFLQIGLIDVSFYALKMKHDNGVYNSVKAIWLGKTWFFSYGSKCPQPISLEDSLIIDISESNQSVSRKVASETSTLVWVKLDVPLVQGDCRIQKNYAVLLYILLYSKLIKEI